MRSSRRGIYFIRANPGDLWLRSASLRFLDFSSDSVTPLLRTMRLGLGLTISPDGRWLVYSQTEVFGSDLILVEGFH